MSVNNRNSSTPIDYDLHGLVGIRLLNASPNDAAAVAQQLGPMQASLTREPDIIIKFVDQLPVSSQVRYLGVDKAGFTDDAFLILRTRNKIQVKVQVAFEEIGKQCIIVCERGLSSVPLLIPIVNLTMLNKGVVSLHASAFNYNGVGVLTMGWAEGGKTETLLAFMANGADYIGDEWIYLSCDGQHMYGVPQPIMVQDWYLQELSQYRALVGWTERVRLWTFKQLAQLMDWAISSGVGRGTYFAQAFEGMGLLFKRHLHVYLSPQTLFSEAVSPLTGTPEKLFFVASHELPEVTVQPMDPEEVARRMVFSLQYERLHFVSDYLKFQFAFPEATNGLIERAEDLEREILSRVLADKEAYLVYHPYPVSIPALFDAISPFCR